MKGDKLYLIHIQECLERIVLYTAKGREAFLTDTLIQDAVMRNLQTLTESALRISATLKSKYPKVDWRGITAFRNVAVHDYLGIDMSRVWDIVERDVPLLRQQIDRILADMTETAP